MTKAVVIRWQLGLMFMFSTQEQQCRAQQINSANYGRVLNIEQSYGRRRVCMKGFMSVSYTHLTLPTIYSV